MRPIVRILLEFGDRMKEAVRMQVPACGFADANSSLWGQKASHGPQIVNWRLTLNVNQKKDEKRAFVVTGVYDDYHDAAGSVRNGPGR